MLYGPDERPLRRAIGFTAEGYVQRRDGDETTVTGIASVRAETFREKRRSEDEADMEPVYRRRT